MAKHISMSALCFMLYMIGNITAELKPIEREYFLILAAYYDKSQIIIYEESRRVNRLIHDNVNFK